MPADVIYIIFCQNESPISWHLSLFIHDMTLWTLHFLMWVHYPMLCYHGQYFLFGTSSDFINIDPLWKVNEVSVMSNVINFLVQWFSVVCVWPVKVFVLWSTMLWKTYMLESRQDVLQRENSHIKSWGDNFQNFRGCVKTWQLVEVEAGQLLSPTTLGQL